uniref:hypothetical protein n=1 Tax=Umezakia ovalisporum TaxID=75695 RepID=UPI0039C684F5
PNPRKGFRDYVSNGNTGVWKLNTLGAVRAHEAGHIFGLDDAYRLYYKLKPGLSSGTSIYDYDIKEEDYASTPSNDAMGSGVYTPSPKIKQFDIDELAKFAIKATNYK